MNNKGFIATSLIYSFFLVFIAITSALIGNYIANKTILDRYNEEIETDLNTSTHTVTVYAKNANIKDGIAMTNIINNGQFSGGLNFWNVETTSGSPFTVSASDLIDGSHFVLKNISNSTTSRLTQKVNLLANSKYYFSVSYSHSGNLPLYTYINTGNCSVFNNTTCPAIEMSDNYESSIVLTKKSNMYSSTNSNNNLDFILASDANGYRYSDTARITNVSLINITASYGIGNEPDMAWLDKNLKWFDGTVSFIQKNRIDSGTSTTITMTPFTGYNSETLRDNPIISCKKSSSADIVSTSLTSSADRTTANLTISNIDDDIVCDVIWRQS